MDLIVGWVSYPAAMTQLGSSHSPLLHISKYGTANHFHRNLAQWRWLTHNKSAIP